MTPVELQGLLTALSEGRIPIADAQARLVAAIRERPYEDLGFARVDHHRPMRQGFPEVILGLGKAPEQIAAIASTIGGRGHGVLVTRTDERALEHVRRHFPDAEFHAAARAITVKRPTTAGKGTIVIATAGTSDVPVAEEAAVTADMMGNCVDRLYDVGVAGIHRVLSERDRFASARVIIVAAGMEGALPSVVAGMVDVPVIAVPTSVGYGASFGGIAALLGMLNSCANSVSVVNIDNGYGAGCIASMINHL
jgi:NCAIR mutase (PurE)-related protein